MIYLICVFIFGTIFGSFSNVLVYRSINGESIISPPSHCDNCKRKIAFYDLIPIFSYINLRRKCRYCKNKLDKSLIIYEIVGGILSLLAFNDGFNLKNIFIFISIIISFVIAMIDIKELYVHMKYIYTLLIIGVLYRFLFLKFDKEFLLIFLIFSLSFFLIYLISNKNIGDGDYFFYICLFLFLENRQILPLILLSIWISAIYSIIIAIKNKSMKICIPFCIYIFIGYLIALKY